MIFQTKRILEFAKRCRVRFARMRFAKREAERAEKLAKRIHERETAKLKETHAKDLAIFDAVASRIAKHKVRVSFDRDTSTYRFAVTFDLDALMICQMPEAEYRHCVARHLTRQIEYEILHARFRELPTLRIPEQPFPSGFEWPANPEAR